MRHHMPPCVLSQADHCKSNSMKSVLCHHDLSVHSRGQRSAAANQVCHSELKITPLSARPIRTSALVASSRPWVFAASRGGPNGSAASYSGDALKLLSRCS